MLQQRAECDLRRNSSRVSRSDGCGQYLNVFVIISNTFPAQLSFCASGRKLYAYFCLERSLMLPTFERRKKLFPRNCIFLPLSLAGFVFALESFWVISANRIDSDPAWRPTSYLLHVYILWRTKTQQNERTIRLQREHLPSGSIRWTSPPPYKTAWSMSTVSRGAWSLQGKTRKTLNQPENHSHSERTLNGKIFAFLVPWCQFCYSL